MGLLFGIIWIVIGIFYVIYKIGEEELELGKLGGFGCVGIFIVALLLLAAIGAVAEENETAGLLMFFLLVAIIVVCVYRAIRNDKRNGEEIWGIRQIKSGLPTPTEQQMSSFIHDIRHEEYPSQLQLEYRDKLENGYAIDVDCFKEMQAAWIYYMKHNSRSKERKRIFAEQELQDKSYFDPSR